MTFEQALEYLEAAGYDYGPAERYGIQLAVKNEEWQTFRKSLKGLTTDQKIRKLEIWWMRRRDNDAWYQITNYLNALKRGGLFE